jgi:hypothetical protein
MQKFLNKFEYFSIEILLEIFEYLSITDCFNAFGQLNWTINSALYLSGFSIDLTSISSQIYNEFYEKIIFQNHSQQIRKLKLSNDLTIDLLERFFHDDYLRDFKQLRSLTLIKPSYMTLGSLALFIPHLEQLEHLSVDANSYPNHFFRSATTKSSSIKSCYLPGLEIEDELTFQSDIEYLTITVENITILVNLLSKFSQLKYLNVSLRSTLDVEEDFSLPEIDLVTYSNLEIFQIYLLQRSGIELNEMEYFFQQILFHRLKTFSYNCITNSLKHLYVTHWNEILSKYLFTIEKFNLFVQIPSNSYQYTDIQQIRDDLQTKLSYSVPFSLSINSSYYIIHTDIYPKNDFYLSSKVLDSKQYLDYDPIHCSTKRKFSKVNSLILDSQSMLSSTILPDNIKYLQIQGPKNDIPLYSCLQYCSNQLLSLKIFGLPNDLPLMPNLRQLTIQQVMFNFKMAMKLSSLCPRLELLTVEIDCIKKFGEIFDHLRDKSNLTELKFIRAFSRDTTETWSSWLDKTKYLDDNVNYDVRNLFLFLWL